MRATFKIQATAKVSIGKEVRTGCLLMPMFIFYLI